MSVIRIVFLGTPDLACHALKSLYHDAHFQIAAVVTQPDKPSGRKMQLKPSPVKVFAQTQGLPVLTPEKINTDEVLSQISCYQAEAAVVVAYGQILSQKFIDLFEGKVVNVHASLLPRWRGASPIQRAILADDPETGVSLQKVVRQLDAGDVLGVRRLVLTDDLNALDVLAKMKGLASELLHIEFMDYLRGNLVGKVQDETQVTYAPKIEKSEGIMDWKNTARFLFNHVRAMVLGPGSTTFFNGKRLKVLRAQVKSLSGNFAPGKILEVDKSGVVVGCSQGCLEILEVQPESRGPMIVGEFLKGNPIKKGDCFG